MSNTERWIAQMYGYWGVPYVFGGKSVANDGGLDCSGLITRAAYDVGLDMGDPYYTSADGLKQHGYQTGTPQRGDLVLFHSTYGNYGPNYATHVGCYLESGWMIDTHDGVHETSLNEPYWAAHRLGYWRPYALEGEEPEEEDALSDSEYEELAFLRSWHGLTMHDYADDLQRQHDQLTQIGVVLEAQPPLDQVQNIVNTLRRGGA